MNNKYSIVSYVKDEARFYLRAMLESCGLEDVEAWAIHRQPKHANECRGFAKGVKCRTE